MDTYVVEIVELMSQKVIRRMGPMSKSTAERVERGALINLNHEQYMTRLVEER